MRSFRPGFVTSTFLIATLLTTMGCGSSDGSASSDGGTGDDETSDASTPDGAHDASSDARADASTHDATTDSATHPLDASVGDSGPPPVGTACATPPCLNVINNCPFPLWIHAINNSNGQVTLMPDNVELAAGGQASSIKQYDLPATWPAARVNAYWEDPTSSSSDPNAFDKVELTWDGTNMNYNITYVDYVALPSRMQAIGSGCDPTTAEIGCNVPVGNILDGCPSDLLSGKRCLSAGLYCANGSQASSPYCHALDAPLATCESQNPSTCGMAAGDTTDNVYQCSGYFGNSPEWCAALNRGVLSDPTSSNAAEYYQTAPYNTYAKWVHETCPGIYAFAYDDDEGQSGFQSCAADRLDVTFCPGG